MKKAAESHHMKKAHHHHKKAHEHMKKAHEHMKKHAHGKHKKK